MRKDKNNQKHRKSRRMVMGQKSERWGRNIPLFPPLLSFILLLSFSCESVVKMKSGDGGSRGGTSIGNPADMFPDKVLPCSDEEGENYTGGEFVFIENINYAKDLLGDLYLPARGKNFPVAIHIHGGGWVAGSRRLPMGRWWGEVFACNGIALFDVEYTLAPKVSIEEQIKELKCALLWTQKEGKEKYGIGDKIIVLGGSAGGHLTAMVSFTKKDFMPSQDTCPWVDEVKKEEIKISAAIPFYGVYDMTEGIVSSIKIVSMQRDLEKISPINYVGEVDFPVLIIHGQADFLVPLYQSLKLHSKLREVGADTTLFVVEKGAHAFDVFPETQFTKKTKEKILDFLKEKGFELRRENTSVFQKLSSDEHIKKGKFFLQEGRFKHAYLEFKMAGQKSCETEYGKLLALSFEMVNDILNASQTNTIELIRGGPLEETTNGTFLATSLKSTNYNSAPGRNAHIGTHISEKGEDNTSSSEWKPDLDLFYDNFILPTENRLKKVEELADYVIQNSCTFYVQDGIPLYEKIFTAEIRIGRKFGREVALIAKVAVRFLNFIFDFVFSHSINFDIIRGKTAKYLAPYFLIKGDEDIIGLLRIAGILYEENPKFLTFIRPEKFRRTKDELSDFLRYLAEFIDEALLSPGGGDVLSLIDSDGSGGLSPSDKFSFGKIYVIPKTHQSQLVTLMNTLESLPIFISSEYISRVVRKLSSLSSKIKNEEYMNISELNAFIPDVAKDFLGKIFPDFISVNIGRFLSQMVPLREFLPEVVETNILPDDTGLPESFPDKLPSFLIEAELGKNWRPSDVVPSESACYVCPPGERFSYYEGLSSVGVGGEGNEKIISKLSDDCIHPDTPFLQGLKRFNFPVSTLIYIYFRRPSFGKNIFVKDMGDGCGFPPEGFREATNFSLNKALNLWIMMVDNVLSSLPPGIGFMGRSGRFHK